MESQALAKTLLESALALRKADAPEVEEVTLLFCDVARSTELTLQLGDSAAYALIHRYHGVVERWTRRCGGEELELRGDGALIAFPDPGRALRCAIGIQRGLAAEAAPRLEVRVGVHTGWALRVEHGYFGSTVIRAARIAESAEPGEILASTALAERLANPTEFRLGPCSSIPLKGFGEPAHVFAVAWQPQAEATGDSRASAAAPLRARYEDRGARAG